jgi:hypothetical protein
MLDISIAVVLGAIMLITAYLGIHVTLHPTESARSRRLYKIGFGMCGLAALSLIGWQAYRANKVQESMREAQENTQRSLTAISAGVASLGSKESNHGLFITEGNAAEMLTLLWKSKTHKVAIFHGMSFEEQSFFSQVGMLLASGQWKIVAGIGVLPSNKRDVIAVEGSSEDDDGVLILQKAFAMAGIQCVYRKRQGQVEDADLILRLP